VLEPQHAANIAWGLVKSGWPAPSFMRALVSAIMTGQ
jgi:hypothetical protein